jgi:hypothetical protein
MIRRTKNGLRVRTKRIFSGIVAESVFIGGLIIPDFVVHVPVSKSGRWCMRNNISIMNNSEGVGDKIDHVLCIVDVSDSWLSEIDDLNI